MRAVAPLCFLSFAITSSIQPLAAQQPTSDSVVRSIIRQRVDDGRNAGVAVGVIDPDGKTRTFAYGPGVGRRPLDQHSVFEIGSITKTFTAVLLADMAAKGEVRLDQPVSEVLPKGVVVPSRNGKPITLERLATHTSALPRLPANMVPRDSANPYSDYDAARLHSFLASHHLTRDIGARVEYSNLGFGLLGHALATRAGVSYEQLVRTRILQPLGLAETAIDLTPQLRARLVPGHDASGRAVPNWDLDVLAGAGALRSSVHDMLRYVAANLSPSSTGIGAALKAAHGERVATEQPGVSMGLAWTRVAVPSGDTILMHNGGTGGYSSFIGFDPKRRVGVVVLSNGARSIDDIGLHLLVPGFPLAKPAVARAEVKLPAAALQRYEGQYRFSSDFAITVARSGEGLTAQGTGQPSFPLFAESNTKFFLKVVDAQVEFEIDAAGNVTALVLVQGGMRQRGVKEPSR